MGAAADSIGARNGRNRCLSLIPGSGGNPIIIARLDRSTTWRAGVRLVAAQVLHCSTLRKCDDTQSAARGDRLADAPQLSCVRKPRTLKVRCSWPQYTSESHPYRSRKLTVAARVTDEEAALGRPSGPVEHRIQLRGLVAPR